MSDDGGVVRPGSEANSPAGSSDASRERSRNRDDAGADSNPLADALEASADLVQATQVDGPAQAGAGGMDALDSVHGDLREVRARAVEGIVRDLTTVPENRAWLMKPRSKGARLVSLLLGCALAAGAGLAYGPMGLAMVGYLVTPLTGPFLAIFLGFKLWDWTHGTRTPTQHGNTVSLAKHFVFGTAIPVLVAAPVYWRDAYGIYLVGPFIALVIMVLATPLMYVVAGDGSDADAQPPEESPEPRTDSTG